MTGMKVHLPEGPDITQEGTPRKQPTGRSLNVPQPQVCKRLLPKELREGDTDVMPRLIPEAQGAFPAGHM